MTKWNLLPDDVIYRIFQFKHELDMTESLRTIERFKYRTFDEPMFILIALQPLRSCYGIE